MLKYSKGSPNSPRNRLTSCSRRDGCCVVNMITGIQINHDDVYVTRARAFNGSLPIPDVSQMARRFERDSSNPIRPPRFGAASAAAAATLAAVVDEGVSRVSVGCGAVAGAAGAGAGVAFGAAASSFAGLGGVVALVDGVGAPAGFGVESAGLGAGGVELGVGLAGF